LRPGKLVQRAEPEDRPDAGDENGSGYEQGLDCASQCREFGVGHGVTVHKGHAPAASITISTPPPQYPAGFFTNRQIILHPTVQLRAWRSM
jgi:hypothetical protein